LQYRKEKYMDKALVLELERNAHLSPLELRKVQPILAKPVDERLAKRAQLEAVARLAGASEKLRKVAETIDIPLSATPDKTRLRDATLIALRAAVAKDNQLANDKTIAEELSGLQNVDVSSITPGAKPNITLADSLHLYEPIAFNPEFQRDLDAAKLYRLTDATGLGDKIADVLIERIGSIAEVTDNRIISLVRSKRLTQAEAKEVGLAASLYHILDERPELVGIVKMGIKNPRELVRNDKATWLKIITDSGTRPPGNISADDYAELLVKKMEGLFPTDFLAYHLSQVEVNEALKDHAGLVRLRKLNSNVSLIGLRNFTSLKTDGIPARTRKQLKMSYDNTVRLVNRYHGMRLTEVLDDSKLSNAKKDREVVRRIDLVNRFFAENTDVLTTDLTPRSAEIKKLKFMAGASDTDKALVLATARTYQRMLAVTDNLSATETLVVSGFPSALSLASASLESVIARTGLKFEIATKYVATAESIVTGIAGQLGSILDILYGGFADTGVGNISPEITSYLKEIPGFAEFFGNQDFCNCEHCQSILGPAAYFIDLMSFVDERITQRYFAGKPNHRLNLKTRRPDLWDLDCTCENTTTSIPYLVIINEILENVIARDVGFAGKYSDRVAVGTEVYKDTLPGQVDSFTQPLHLPFEEIRTYLEHFDRSFADLAEAGKATDDTLARLRLGLPLKDYQLVTQANTNMPFLRRIYNIQFTDVGGIIQKFDAQQLLKPMNVNRGQLGELINTQYVTGKGALIIRIIGDKRTTDSIQNDIEYIEGLTTAALDRMHRFVRLWRATGWRMGELDLVLSHVEQAGFGSGLTTTAVQTLAEVHRLQTRSQLSIEELVALWSLLPRRAVLFSVSSELSTADSDALSIYPEPASPLARLTISLFDRLFNQTRFVATGNLYPQPGTMFLHPALATIAPANVDPNLHRLQAGTGTDDDELYQLIVGLAKPLGIDPGSADDNKKKFALSHRNLSLLYRHARLARMLDVSISELFALASLAPRIQLACIETLSDLRDLLSFSDWWKTTTWSLAELVRIVRPGLPVILTSPIPVASTAAGDTITYICTNHGTVEPAETIAFAANADIDAVIADWNAKAQHTLAYQSDQFGIASTAGTYFSIRTKSSVGPDSKLEITVDSASILTTALPEVVSGRTILPPLPQMEAVSSEELAQQLIDQANRVGALVFADRVFALMPPLSAIATSRAPLPSTAGGEVVTYTPVFNGRVEAAETITLAVNATLDEVVDDWNSKASFTKAFRSDANGSASATGTYFSAVIKNASGNTTRLSVTADSAGIFTGTPPQVYRGTEISEVQSRAVITANAALLEVIDTDGHFRLKSGFDPNAALTMPAEIHPALAPLLEPLMRNILKRYHSEKVLQALLPGITGISPEILPQLISMLGIDLASNDYFRELRTDTAPANKIAELIARLQRLATLFTPVSVFDSKNMAFIEMNAGLFGIGDFERIKIVSVKGISMFKNLVAAWLDREEEAPDLKALLLAFDSTARFSAADQEDLAVLLSCDLGLLQSLSSQLNLSTTPFETLEELMNARSLAQHIGIGGDTLKLMQSTDYDELVTVSGAIQAAFRSKYENEAEWEKQVEPFHDALLSRQRDGLVAYLVHSSPLKFDEVSDLYNYFLLDVELDGCMRTSRVAAAIDSLQLYIQRCMMNLEQTAPGDSDPVHVLPDSIRNNELAFRMNYRMFEANRKIFLYPENYLEPELRDDKTPLFKTLEEELLSKEITEEAILEAYSRYLRGFDELAHLTIAGSYHEKDATANRDVLHLFGVTNDEPPIYYYRRVENAHYGVANDARSTHWGAWEKLNIQVPVRKVAPVTYNNQLYVFWIRYTTKSQNRLVNGESRFSGYQHQAHVEFSRRKLDGSWTTPQRLRLDERPFGPNSFPASYQDDGVILDAIVPKTATSLPVPWFSFTLYTNFQPLYDTNAHEVPRDDYAPRGFQWDQLYPGSGSELSLRGVNFQMWSPIDLYRLKIGPQYSDVGNAEDEGVPWLNPAVFAIIWLLSLGKFDLTSLLPPRLVWSRLVGKRREVHSTPSGLPCFDTYTYASLLLDEARIKHFERPLAAVDPAGSPGMWTGPQWDKVVTDYLANKLKQNKIADIPADATLDVVNGSVADVIIQTSKDAFYLQADARKDGKYHLRRLNTSLSEDIANLLFNRGLEVLLSTEQQLKLKEHATGLNLIEAQIYDDTKTGQVDYDGPMGTYLREIFCHIPSLIANIENSQGKFEEAQRWYHFIFDPTASETIQGLPAGISDEERRRRELDRNWRYREFRGQTLDSLRAQLIKAEAIEQYKRNPFNPHAIARVRTSAYQKAIVMKYVDNLLDWGDDDYVKAFAQLNPEYLREATLKYVMAREILGDRPAELGDCDEGALSPKSFTKIKEVLIKESEFLMEMESIIGIRFRLGAISNDAGARVMVDAERGAWATEMLYTDGPIASLSAPRRSTQPISTDIRILMDSASDAIKEMAANFTIADAAVVASGTENNPVIVDTIADGFLRPEVEWVPNWANSVVRQIIFCIPRNKRLLKYWDRVEDRLYNLRHCRDIEGVFRRLPLFAPEIDLDLLVAGRAAGLSLDDILAAAAGGLPPYRFRYLLDKAKGLAATVQTFGAALLSALEKRDAEELSKLRNVHQKNILTLTTEIRRNELKIAEESVEVVNRRQAAAQDRIDFYADLIAGGLSPAEIVQTTAQSTALAAKATQTAFGMAAGISFLLPQVGSPFSMKYGGKEVGDSLLTWSAVVGIIGQVADITGSIARMASGFERRAEGWEYQQKLAEHDLKIIDKELAVAELRNTIASQSLDLHEKAIEQQDEVMDFFGNKFSNLGLYTYLSRALQQLHREAYNNALSVARLAQQAYRFERPDDHNIFIGGEWDASRSGLLAGERLMLALNNMDRRFIETNNRQSEINLSLSLSQIDPQALIKFKELGHCEFAIPEFYFDMFYPGQYQRLIRAVRLTIPCITGPYTNVSAKLTLLQSYIRKEAVLGTSYLLEVPSNRTSSVATSTAQGDAGVFELNFRDERYMPFEGAGAISEWRLELPSSFHPFDYQSINDVILNISYTAQEDEDLRKAVETQNAMLEGSLLNYLTKKTLTRVFSLRQEFSNAFNRLVQSTAGTSVTLDITDRHFPLFLNRRSLTVADASMVLNVENRSAVGVLSISINGTPITGFSAPTNPPATSDPFAGLPLKKIGSAAVGQLKRQHTLVVNNAGSLAAAAGAGSIFDTDKLRDILLVIEYRL
jgi:hypothetical protein